ncbi:DUF3127 domain-containing protein [Cruoricaptor ignavus]|uniref:DUF3127 domain-containing protein n=1 Tax=Cruoricaptor ignavus TaxID=1118202 RepID=A0A7M1T1Y5_9FLAO|nr:DUF3127 domain-containing protein [Cruoricaptor ignavus]QOR73267.1 DUF3127 domain-containing protein [Cruoricaptor ignavus]
MELQGTVKKLTDIQTFPSGFQKRELILNTTEQYPQVIAVEFTQDKINLLDSISEGDEVKVSINIRGREWTSPQGEVKYFTSIGGWRIEKLSTTTVQEPTQAAPVSGQTLRNDDPFADDEDDDLPF